MKHLYVSILALFACALLPAQGLDSGATTDSAQVQVGPNLPLHKLDHLSDGTGAQLHPVYFEHRRPVAGCANTAICGELLDSGWTHNLRTSAGTTYEYNQMLGSTAAVMSYIGLTNTAITPAFADTTLSGEIVSNGLARAAATPTNSSTTLSVPAAPTPTVVGATGATTYYYWVGSCNFGICTTPSATSGSVTTANATLSTTNYVSVAYTGQLGAQSYQLYRTTSNVAPSGTASVLVGGSPACSTAGTVVSCTWLDVSNTLTSVTIPASNLTNFGKATLVYTWTATGAQSAQAFGIFNAASSGTMAYEGIYTGVTLNINDTLQLTWTRYY